MLYEVLSDTFRSQVITYLKVITVPKYRIFLTYASLKGNIEQQ